MSKIERVEVFVASPGRTFVTLRITTDDGVTGLGDAMPFLEVNQPNADSIYRALRSGTGA